MKTAIRPDADILGIRCLTALLPQEEKTSLILPEYEPYFVYPEQAAWDRRRNTCLISGATNDGKAIMNIPVHDCFLDHKDGIRTCILRYLAREYIKTQLGIPVDLVIQNHGTVRLKPEQCIPEDDDGFIVDGDLAGFFFKDTTEVRTAIQAADNQHKLTYCKPVFLWHQNLFLGFYSLTLDMTFHIRKIDRYAVDISIGIVETLTDKLKEVKHNAGLSIR